MTSQPCEVVVLAGGQGTRLRSVSGGLPKALVPVGGKPFLEWKLAELSKGGASRVHLLTGYGADQIADFLSTAKPPVEVVVQPDGPTPLGTGGALVAYADQLPDSFVVTYGDSLLDAPLNHFWNEFLRCGLSAQLAVTKQFDSAHFGNVAVDGGRVIRYAKDPDDDSLTWLDYGYMAFKKRVLFDYGAATPIDLGRIVADTARQGQLAAYPVTERFWEVGTPDSYAEVEQHLSSLLKSAEQES